MLMKCKYRDFRQIYISVKNLSALSSIKNLKFNSNLKFREHLYSVGIVIYSAVKKGLQSCFHFPFSGHQLPDYFLPKNCLQNFASWSSHCNCKKCVTTLQSYLYGTALDKLLCSFNSFGLWFNKLYKTKTINFLVIFCQIL